MVKFSTTTEHEDQRQRTLKQQRGDPQQGSKHVVYGNIVAQRTVVNPRGEKTIQVKVSIDNTVSLFLRSATNKYYSLAYPVDFIFANFGDDLVGRRCRVEYNTPIPNNGLAFITGDTGDPEKMTVATIGTILAPAGSL